MDEVSDVSEIPMNDEIQSESSERPMSAPPQQAPEEFEFTANGRPVKADRTKTLQWASQGYDYAQKMGEFQKQRSEFDNTYKTYQEIDKFAQGNPEWWNHIQSQYSQRSNFQGQTQQPDTSLHEDPKFKPIMDEIQDLRKFKDEFVAERSQKQRETEDQQLKDEVESIRKNYSNLDFTSPGENGKNLETQVLEYAVNNGIKSFKTAFRDFYHEKLLERAKEEGKELAAKEVQKRSKLGLLGETSTPRKQVSPASDLKNKSYDSLLNETLEELGLTGSSIRR